MASVGSILAGAFGLIARRPGAVLAWGFLYLFGFVLIAFFQAMASYGMVTTPEGQVAPVTPGSQFLGEGLTMALLAVLMGAVFRAVLRPQEHRFASIRIGMDEVRLFVLLLLVGLVALVGGLLIGLFDAFLVGALTLASGGSATAIVTGQLLIMLLLTGGLIYLTVRLSLVWPLTFYRGKITVDGAWDLTRGRFWLLFFSYFAVWLVVFSASLLIAAMLFGDILAGAMLHHAGYAATAQTVTLQILGRVMATTPALQVVMVAIGFLLTSIGLALHFGVVASAARVLLEDRGEAVDHERVPEFF